MPSETPMRFIPIGPTSDRAASFEVFPERPEYEKFYTAYGECFSVWSEVEVNLLAVFVFLLQSPNYEAASSTFYSTTGFRSKLEMTDAVVTNSKRISKDDKNVWEKIKQTASKSSLRRNQLAHNVVFYGRQSDGEKRRLFIGNPRAPYENSRLHTHDLTQIQESFTSLAKELFEFWQRLASHAQKA